MRLITPERTWSMMPAWQAFSDDPASVRSRMPSAATSASTRRMTLSPSRKWWWKVIVSPFFRPVRMIASRSEATTLRRRLDSSSRRCGTFAVHSVNGFRPASSGASAGTRVFVIFKLLSGACRTAGRAGACGGRGR